jgi:hypothetical protein
MENSGLSFQGSIVLGVEGFLVSNDRYSELIALDAKYADVLFPYLNGDELNDSPTREAERKIINFSNWPRERAARYHECFAQVERLVKPMRQQITYNPRARDHWWQYHRPTVQLYEAISGMGRALAIAQVSKTAQVDFVSTGQVLDAKLIVFALDDYFHFGCLSSGIHLAWAFEYCTTMRTDFTYTPTRLFETFPFPTQSNEIEGAAETLWRVRDALMVECNEGLTKTYNRVHLPEDSAPNIIRLRELHVGLDYAVRNAYGWHDLELDHGFHSTDQGTRFTIGPTARLEVLDRLVEENHRRHEAEVNAGLVAPLGKKKVRRERTSTARTTLF